MSYQVFEIDVRLCDITPPIWRTIELPGSSTLEALHYAIQVAMGWTNSHLHQFKINDVCYGMTDVDDTGELEFEDETEVQLKDVAAEGETFVYEYDFGDGWEHEVTISKVRRVPRVPSARCIAGARACPPEDCCGFGGYERLLHALASPTDTKHRDLVEWAGSFEPEYFAIPKTGRDLEREMSMLRELANRDLEPAEVDDPNMGLPKRLVDAVLQLEPMQLAALNALIGGQLASELLETRAVAGSLVAATQKNRHSVRSSGRRSRS